MNKNLTIDIAILILAPLLSIGIACMEFVGGFVPYEFNMPLVMQYAFAPIVWFSYIGVSALILWIFPILFLLLMVLSWCKSWKKTGHLSAALFSLCWIIIVQFFMFLHAMETTGAC